MNSLSAYNIDITNENQVKDLCSSIEKNFGRLDGLINNAAINPKIEEGKEDFHRLENFDLDIWKKEIDVGLTGAFICSKNFGPANF